MIALEDLVVATAGDVAVAGRVTSFEGFAHDARAIAPGECFVAVRGMHRDGHEYAVDAIERGAGAVIMERDWLELHPVPAAALAAHARRAGVTLLTVASTRDALCRYAHYVLSTWKPTVICVTGGTGKTTTKEAIATVLALHAPTFRSWRNYNDLLGLPLSLGRLEPGHRFAVLELGADHPGEIAALCGVVQPEIGVVTNVSPGHLQYFGSVSELEKELGNLPALLPRTGLAVLNADADAAQDMASRTQAAVRFFAPVSTRVGLGDRLTLRYRLLPMSTRHEPVLQIEDEISHQRYTFPHLHADHWAYAVLAALTVGAYVGVAREKALNALRQMRPLPGRMCWLEGIDGAILLDDSHNATPTSAVAGLSAMSVIAKECGAVRIAVLGDMLRLGDQEEREHVQLGEAAAREADYLVTCGVRAETIARSAALAACPSGHIAVTQLAADSARAVRQFIDEARQSGRQSVIYIKGSEEMRMEQVTGLLLAHPEQAEQLLDRQTQAWQRVIVMRPDRPTWLEIDLGAIANNTRLMRELLGPAVRHARKPEG